VGAGRVALVNCAVFAALLVILELVFGNWIRPMEINDLKRFSIPVGVQYEMDISNLYGREGGALITYTRDQWGLRGRHTRPADIDVLTIGGSTTDQRYLDDSETWQSYAERWLAEHGAPLVFGNAGVDGQSTTGHLFSFDNWLPLLPELHPQIVLFYVGINDVTQPSDRTEFDAKLDAGSWRVKSVTWQILRTIRGNMQARDARVVHGRKPVVTEADFTSTGKLTVERQLELAASLSERFINNVNDLRQRVLAMGATPVFVTQTAYAWKSGASAPRGLNRPIRSLGQEMNFADISLLHSKMNERLLEYCRSEGVLCFDLSADVPFDDNDFYDFLHTAPSGAEKIGTYIAERLMVNAVTLRSRDKLTTSAP
jgi:lysophospholipase L1-like esterase